LTKAASYSIHMFKVSAEYDGPSLILPSITGSDAMTPRTMWQAHGTQGQSSTEPPKMVENCLKHETDCGGLRGNSRGVCAVASRKTSCFSIRNACPTKQDRPIKFASRRFRNQPNKFTARHLSRGAPMSKPWGGAFLAE